MVLLLLPLNPDSEQIETDIRIVNSSPVKVTESALKFRILMADVTLLDRRVFLGTFSPEIKGRSKVVSNQIMFELSVSSAPG